MPATEQPLIGEYLTSSLTVNDEQLTLSAGRYAARWKRTPRHYSLDGIGYRFDSIGGLYPTGPHGWEPGSFVQINESNYERLPTMHDLVQNPALGVALEFDRYQRILNDRYDKLPLPDSFEARPFDAIQPKPPDMSGL